MRDPHTFLDAFLMKPRPTAYKGKGFSILKSVSPYNNKRLNCVTSKWSPREQRHRSIRSRRNTDRGWHDLQCIPRVPHLVFGTGIDILIKPWPFTVSSTKVDNYCSGARFIKRRNLRPALRYADRLTPIFSRAQIPFHQIAYDQS